MAAGAGSGRPKLEIWADRLLLVEGRDEGNLFDALIRHRFGGERRSEIQIIDAGGRDRFPGNLRAIALASRNVRAVGAVRDADDDAVGAVRDADDDAVGAFRSICGHLRQAGYAPPAAHGGFSGATPAVGVFIVPDGNAPGAVETLCRRSREGDAASGCVEGYMSCLDERGAMRSGNRDKTFAHTYLAATDDPVARVGEGALQGAWNFDSDAFADLSAFLRQLLSA